MQQVRIMVTYVETACSLWGQVLTPDMMDTHRQMESNLSEVGVVGKSSVLLDLSVFK